MDGETEILLWARGEAEPRFKPRSPKSQSSPPGEEMGDVLSPKCPRCPVIRVGAVPVWWPHLHASHSAQVATCTTLWGCGTDTLQGAARIGECGATDQAHPFPWSVPLLPGFEL